MRESYEQTIDSSPDYIYVPQQTCKNSLSVVRDEPKLIVMIPGAFHTGETFNLLEDELQNSGHETMAVTLDSENISATSETDAIQVAEAIGNKEGVIVFAWSRGVETLIRLPAHLESGQLDGAIVMGSGGPHEFLLRSEQDTNTRNPRYEDGYIKGMISLPDNSGLYRYDPTAARQFFYHDLPEELANTAIHQMIKQRQFVADVPLQPWDPNLPTLLLLGEQDRVLERARARAVGRLYFNSETEMIEGGHSLHLSQPKLLGERILSFINDQIPSKIS